MQIINAMNGKIKKKLEYKIPGLIYPEFDEGIYRSMLVSLFKWYKGKITFLEEANEHELFAQFNQSGKIPSWEFLQEGREHTKSQVCKVDGEYMKTYYSIQLIK